ncbi:MAG: hypothetical protein H6767_07990 [Candidatus Peribacteria bacterium]|nr:MAG: hypothetical protein H6767_07990 [Candidatus Peribacteria bacterium]
MGQETLNIGDSSPYPKLPFSNIPTLNGQKTVIIGENISGTPKSDDIFDGFLCAFNQDLESCKRIVEKSTGEAADELR